uniref:Uncharacterized protein n=1 Tax=Timema tahoe TaxID=61484 RepID=A0A7R9IFE1_9NEOP|nr:unnamed protein product [Timema tahoe]
MTGARLVGWSNNLSGDEGGKLKIGLFVPTNRPTWKHMFGRTANLQTIQFIGSLARQVVESVGPLKVLGPILRFGEREHNSWDPIYVAPPCNLCCLPLLLCVLQQYAAKQGGQDSLLENMNTKYYYYTRTTGLFRICYPKERPPTARDLHTNLTLGNNPGRRFSALYGIQEKVADIPNVLVRRDRGKTEAPTFRAKQNIDKTVLKVSDLIVLKTLCHVSCEYVSVWQASSTPYEDIAYRAVGGPSLSVNDSL